MKLATVKIKTETGFKIINVSDQNDDDVTLESFEAEDINKAEAKKDKAKADKKKKAEDEESKK
jgi:hypothetical protein